MAHLKLEGVAPDEKDSAVVVAAVRQWLQSHAGWLFIIDNADDLGVLHEMHAMPPGHARGHVLVTTRANLSSSADSLLEKLMPGSTCFLEKLRVNF